MKLEPGTVVDRYTVQSLLGAGGTAMVYLVEHNQLKTRHALKVLTITSEAIRLRMLREGQVQASLKHLNVVAVTDVLDVEGNPGLVMEFIEGPSLESALHRYRLSMRDAEILYKGILSGVRHAHASGLVHRDLKPANVLLFRTKNGYVPKVTDFGLAKVIEGETIGTGHTRSGIAMGTPSFMAPEQIRDARSVDQRADIFSLGCILYELILRRRAFPGEEALEIYNKVCDGEYVSPKVYEPDMPDRLDMAIRGCLITDRNERIPDCETLAAVMEGKETWSLPEPTAEIPLRAPVPVTSEVSMPVAERGPPGQTPAPVPRVISGGLGLAQVSSAEASPEIPGIETLRQSPIDGTLDATDSIVPTVEDSATANTRLVLVAVLVITIALLLLLGGMGLLGSVLLSRDGSNAQVPASSDTEPTTVPATPGQEAEVPAPPSEPTTAPEPAPPPEPTPSPAPSQAAPAPAPKPVVRPRPRPVPKAPVPLTVKLLSQPPTALITVDGQPSGRTPAKLALTPGTHQVTVESGGDSQQFSIRVTEGGANKWCYAFESAMAHAGSCPR